MPDVNWDDLFQPIFATHDYDSPRMATIRNQGPPERLYIPHGNSLCDVSGAPHILVSPVTPRRGIMIEADARTWLLRFPGNLEEWLLAVRKMHDQMRAARRYFELVVIADELARHGAIESSIYFECYKAAMIPEREKSLFPDYKPDLDGLYVIGPDGRKDYFRHRPTHYEWGKLPPNPFVAEPAQVRLVEV